MDLKEVNKQNEFRHPWELSRADFITKIAKPYISSMGVIADIGAGDMFFAKNLGLKGIHVVDVNYPEKTENSDLIVFNSIDQLKDGKYDLVFLLDVLEHVQEDSAFLKKIVRKLKPSGRLIITVPAFNFLFSSHDKFLGHHRRYSMKSLTEIVMHEDLALEFSSYFYSLLVPLRFIDVLLEKVFSRKTEKGVGSWYLSETHGATRLLRSVLNLDASFNVMLRKLGIKIPGLSLLLVCERR